MADSLILKYHPFRFIPAIEEVVLDAVDFYEEHSQEDKETLKGLLWNDCIEEALSRLIDGMSPYWYEEASALFSTVGEFVTSGKNIFHIEPGLAEMFRQSDVLEVALESLKPPFKTLYLYWGDIGIKYFDKVVDGAYVDCKDFTEIFFTTLASSYPFEILEPKDILLKEPFHALMLSEADDELITIGDAIKDMDKPSFFDEYQRNDYEAWSSSRTEALCLVINAICFLNSKHNDTNEDFSEGAPATMVAKFLRSKTNKEKKRNLSKLESMGYRQIKFLGRSPKYRVSFMDTGRVHACHWRRGFWRNQACGPKLSERKYTWIMPTLVAKRHDEEFPQKGHIYTVGN